MEPEAAQSCLQCLNDELKPENVAPIHDRSRLFVDSQWTTGRMSTAYVVYRVIVAILMVAWVIADFLEEAGQFYRYNYAIWLLYATNWSMLTICITTICMAITSVYYYYRTRHRFVEFPKPIGYGLRVQWILYTIATNSAVVVSISYWSFIFIFVNNNLSNFMTTPMSQLKHSLNTIYVVVDMFANAMPVRVYHVIYPLLTGLVYTIFNVVYFVNNGRGPNGHPYAYDLMDWRYPFGSTFTVLLGFVLAAIAQLLLYGFYRARIAAHRRLAALMAPDAVIRYRPSSGLLGDDSATADELAERGPIFPNGLDAGVRTTNGGYSALGTTETSDSH